MAYYGAWITSPVFPDRDMRIAGGSEQYCEMILAQHLAHSPGRTGYVRQMSDRERDGIE